MPRELTFSLDGRCFAAQAWGDPGQLPVLALHGWLDNSASFSVLAPLLDNLYLVALDMAGHGQSDSRPGVGPYNIWEDVAEVFAIADELGWKKFTLLGHSRGAIVSVLAAGTFPERISQLALIEGLLPENPRAEDAPEQLAQSINALKAIRKKQPTLYPDIQAAISAREKGAFPLSSPAARALTERGVKPVDGGYHWSTDPRLLAPSAIKLTPAHVAAFVDRIKAPVKLILAQEGIPKRFANFQRDVSAFSRFDIVKLHGGHHLHMEAEAPAVAQVLNGFFQTSSQDGAS
jgi:pimeloyl-ACP methyl ester carboxylesterase